MKKTREQKGITLIALIITIVVLMILASVAISSIKNDGILSYAENAVGKYENEQKKEQILLDDLETYLNGGVPSVESLERKYEFSYYSTMGDAVNFVNGVNDDTDETNNVTATTKENATAGVYTDENGNVSVVLLKDSTESTRLAPTKDVTINLGGHVLTIDEAIAIDGVYGADAKTNTITIDGRLQGSRITANGTKNNLKLFRTGISNIIVNGGTYLAKTVTETTETSLKQMACAYVESGGKMKINNANLTMDILLESTETVTSTVNIASIIVYGAEVEVNNSTINTRAQKDVTYNTTYIYGVVNYSGKVKAQNCNINVNSNILPTNENEINVMGWYDAGEGEEDSIITNCNIKAYSNYNAENGNYTVLSTGISNYGTMTINNCNVMGTHSGVSNTGNLYVDGGTYEGYGHGGFYFSTTDSTTTDVYVQNATIRECDMPEGYTATSGMDNNAGFYIGGSAEAKNIVVHMDNCDINASFQPIVLRSGVGEENNTLYISNSRIDIKKVRIDGSTHRLYMGRGCNFTSNDVWIKDDFTEADLITSVFSTDEVYSRP